MAEVLASDRKFDVNWAGGDILLVALIPTTIISFKVFQRYEKPTLLQFIMIIVFMLQLSHNQSFIDQLM